MKFSILTQFPEMFGGVLGSSMLAKAAEKGLLSFNIINIRDFTSDRHNRTDDTPFGGGEGMVMLPQPAFDALDSIDARNKKCIYMSPRGRLLSKKVADELLPCSEIVILCGHYEGIDQRIINQYNMDEISIGDYILTGGELPAMVLIDTVSRLIPGVLGNAKSSLSESVYSGLLEADMYTKPRIFNNISVPEVLFSGDHEKIHLWQFENSLSLTKQRRRDLFDDFVRHSDAMKLSKAERKLLNKMISSED